MLLDFTLGLFNTYAIGDEGELNGNDYETP